MSRILPILLAATALLAVAAAPASADSIAYVKDGNVWLSTGDGSRQFQVTTSGGYMDVSQADDGTMIALNGVRLHRLDRMGNVLADFDTPVSDTRPIGSKVFWGPFDPAISPDGKKVAYTYYYMTTSQDPSCYPPTCVTTINEGGTGYSAADRQTAWDEAGFYRHSGWRNPTWLDNETTILSDPTHLPNADVVVDQHAKRPGATGFLAQNWYSDTDQAKTSAGDVTRDGTKLAFTTGIGETALSFYAVPSFPTSFPDGLAPESTRPVVCYRYTGPNGGSYGTPTFSPDGAHAAFSEGDGIRVVDVPSFAGGCTMDGASPNTRLLIAGGSQPDWGPADVPAGRPAPQQPAQQPGAAAKLKVKAAKLRKALRKGLSVSVTGVTGQVEVLARRGAKVVARGKGTAPGTVKVRFTKAAKRALRARKKVTLKVTAAGVTTKLTLRR